MASQRFINTFVDAYNRERKDSSKFTKVSLKNLYFFYVNEEEDILLHDPITIYQKDEKYFICFALDSWKVPGESLIDEYATDNHVDLAECVKHLLDILSTAKRCRECGLIAEKQEQKKLMEEGLTKFPTCHRCYSHVILADHSKRKVEQCPICHEECYISKLECGHSVHALCLRKYAFSKVKCLCKEDITEVIKCPLCRSRMTEEDITRMLGVEE